MLYRRASPNGLKKAQKAQKKAQKFASGEVGLYVIVRIVKPTCRMQRIIATSILYGSRAFSSASGVAGGLHAPTRTGKRVFVILRDSLDTLGVTGEEVPVAPGFARNYLIPQRKAVYATALNRARFKVELTVEEAARSADDRQARLVRGRVSEIALVFKRASVDGVKLFGGVTTADVAAALISTPLRNLGVTDTRVRLGAVSMITDVGEHTIEIEPKASPGLWCELKVRVVAT